MNNTGKLFSKYLVAISFIIFSVVIPFVQVKVDYWERQREIYSQNLLNAEFQRVVGVLAANIYETIGIVKESKIINDPEAVKIVDKIQNLYLGKAKEAATNMQFLQTEMSSALILTASEFGREISVCLKIPTVTPLRWRCIGIRFWCC